MELYLRSNIAESFLTAAKMILSVSVENGGISPLTFSELNELYYHYRERKEKSNENARDASPLA